MKFAGLVKNSFVDYPGQISAVVFTYGCNFNCWYCHNRQLIGAGTPASISAKMEKVSQEEVMSFLSARKGMLDALVISGGEPTLHNDLQDFIKQVKALDYLIKLDTNGTNPEILQQLITEKLVDFVAMDIKTDLNKYSEIVGDCCNIDDIKKSINILKNSDVDYEFRTTFAPDISLEDIENVCKTIEGTKSFAIQKYFPTSDKILKIPHNKDTFNKALEIAKKYIPNSFLRSVD